ncbi:uncharacterized protein PFL1_05253 [Pseudozyma flocculosa PF-1]|uniref:Uncharacterized protein n=2 Tax=Pseudozyma flocculosa TaxID=84751 RepID=A0A5C3F5C3_9BASI|nr:uncharacterized protein PFL1_05253 [Pseudozyma flocculosa PF-1]EPQ27331.1 hypothetical protein PFL1_05253 [Pseudozyma flocculosa PF-1]SPO39704.1 uncharacterized protein PSFLO_05185 [Pseudozyma flocculosa]
MQKFVDLAHRATVTGLAGLGIWGLWLTAAVWKSRRDDRAIHAAVGPPAIGYQDPNPVTNDPKHEPARRV